LAREGTNVFRNVAAGRRECHPAEQNGRLVEENRIHLVPLLFGEGTRLLDIPGSERVALERTRVI
jgi:hypothetical protein